MQYDVEIRKITIFSGEGYGRASANFRLGPLVVRGAKVFEKDGRRWLSMPGRKGSNGDWIDTVFLEDRELRDHIEKLVLREYERHMNTPQEELQREEVPL